jgi:hypothetical protein
MAHTIRDKQKLLNCVRRIKGQIEGVEKAIDQAQDCSAILERARNRRCRHGIGEQHRGRGTTGTEKGTEKGVGSLFSP